MSKRRKGREMALQMLYQSDLGGVDGAQVTSSFERSEPPHSDSIDSSDSTDRASDLQHQKAFEYACQLVQGTLDRIDEIDQLIRSQADHWRIERMPAVDRNILRLAVYEFLYELDVPKLVIVDQAIELAKKFGGEDSGRFVNGLLDGLLKTQSFAGSMT